MVHRMGVMDRPVVVMGAFPRHVEPCACLRHSGLFFRLSVTVIIVVGVLGLFPSGTGTLFFIAVYSVGVLNDLV